MGSFLRYALFYVVEPLRKLLRPRLWPFIALLLLLTFIGRLLAGVGVLAPVEKANQVVIQALSSLDPFFVSRAFSESMHLCRYDAQQGTVCSNGPVYMCSMSFTFTELTDCNWEENPGFRSPPEVEEPKGWLEQGWGFLARRGTAIMRTLYIVWEQGWTARLVLGLTLALTTLLVVPIVIRSGLAFVYWLAFIPITAGVLAWALKYSLLLLTLAFDVVLGLAVWLTSIVVGVWKLIGIINKAEELQTAGDQIASSFSSSSSSPPSEGTQPPDR
ncbi:hypothetical protein SO078_16590 (plasmid) [Sinorhizobium meliloti]|uniref:hypothetical protein n=1 Tax=Rhizobium meliloti TaxID=382 RepID=UPI002D76FE44|nr:hypothetical protein [Sinorhizobium meliloti]WRQ70932.1 hypothetical protein SO078_16590 [Sinorhizobium meliloti]